MRHWQGWGRLSSARLTSWPAADVAMYRAKDLDNDRVEEFSGTLSPEALGQTAGASPGGDCRPIVRGGSARRRNPTLGALHEPERPPRPTYETVMFTKASAVPRPCIPDSTSTLTPKEPDCLGLPEITPVDLASFKPLGRWPAVTFQM